MKIPFGARRAAAPLPLARRLARRRAALPAQAQTEDPPDEVVVTGVPHERAAGELAQSVTVVAGDELDRSRAATLGETLANQLGVSSSYFGAGASRPIIRGFAGARVQMLEDGIDTMDAATRQRRSRRHRRAARRGPDRDLPRSDDAALRQRRRRRRRQHRHDAHPDRAPDDGFEGASRCAATAPRDGAQCGRAPRRRRSAIRLALRRRAAATATTTRFRASRTRTPTREAGPDDAFGVLGEQRRRERIGRVRCRPGSAITGFVGVGINAFDTLYGIPGHVHEREARPRRRGVRIDLEQRRVDLRGGWDGPRRLRRRRQRSTRASTTTSTSSSRATRSARGSRTMRTELRVELLHRARRTVERRVRRAARRTRFRGGRRRGVRAARRYVDDRPVHRRAARPRVVGAVARRPRRVGGALPSNGLPRSTTTRDELVVRQRCGRSATATRSWRRSRRRSGCRSPRSSIRTGRISRPASCRSATLDLSEETAHAPRRRRARRAQASSLGA